MLTKHQLHDREDGLAHCKVCHGGEGSLPSHCPGRSLTLDEEQAIMRGQLDYWDGAWHQFAKPPGEPPWPKPWGES